MVPQSGGALPGGSSTQLRSRQAFPAEQSTSLRHSSTHWPERQTNGSTQSELRKQGGPASLSLQRLSRHSSPEGQSALLKHSKAHSRLRQISGSPHSELYTQGCPGLALVAPAEPASGMGRLPASSSSVTSAQLPFLHSCPVTQSRSLAH